MRVYMALNTNNNCFTKCATKKSNLMQHNKYSQQQQENHEHYNEGIHNNEVLWSLPIKKRCNIFAFIFIMLYMQHYIVTFSTATAAAAATSSASYNDRMIHSNGHGDSGGIRKGFRMRMRSPKIASIHILQPVPESLLKSQKHDHHQHHYHRHDAVGDGAVVNGKRAPAAAQGAIDNQTNTPPAGKFEIRSVFGEPNYKSVNLTWEVEFVPSVEDNIVTNSSAEVQAPTLFQIFFCEIQSFGPHRCRSKVVNESSSLEMYDNTDNDLEPAHKIRKVRQYVTQVDNLRMATKYSFHIRSAPQRKNMKITGRSELFNNEIEGEDVLTNNVGQGQTIIIPTKGFSAQATRCLPTASEIEVETGPYFGGKIVVDGGNCGLKGDPSDPKEKYVMRIDHKMCGSMVKQETNTVETFITVQENLGIFTHSTRRFVVLCSYQSGLQTVRASFSVPGRGGAAAVQQDHYEEDERMGRGLKQMRYVDKSELVLKETTEEDDNETASTSEETQAVVKEMVNPTINYNKGATEVNTANASATLEKLMPRVNEKYTNEQTEVNENEQQNKANNETAMKSDIQEFEKENSRMASTTTMDNDDDVKVETKKENEHEQFSANFAKLTFELDDEQEVPSANRLDNDNDDDIFGLTPTGRGFSGLELMALNMGSVMLTVLLSVILIGILIYVLYRETKLPSPVKHKPDRENTLSPSSLNVSLRHHEHRHLQEVDNNLPRTLKTKNQDLLA